MDGSICSMLCRVADGQEGNNNFGMAEQEFKENGKVRLRLQPHLFWDGSMIYFWDVIFLKTGQVVWKIKA